MTVTPSVDIGAWSSSVTDGFGVTWKLRGMSGFEDLAPARVSTPDRAGADGGVDQRGFKSSRVVTFTGQVTAPTRAARAAAKRRLLDAAGDLSAGVDVTVHLDDGDFLIHGKQSPSAPWQIAPFGPFGFQYQASLTCADPLIYSSTLHTASASLIDQSAGTGQLQFPFNFPFDFGGPGVGVGQMLLTNAGTETTYPMFTINGPGTNLRLDDAASGNYMILTSLGSGQFVTLDTRLHRVLLMGYQPARQLLGPGSEWFGTPPGGSTVVFGASAFTTANVTATWRDAY